MVRHVLVSNYPGDKHILLELSEDVPVLVFSSAQLYKWLQQMIATRGAVTPCPVSRLNYFPVEFEMLFQTTECDEHPQNKRARV
jgi:hypothetical protein